MKIIVLVDFSLYTKSLINVATNWADLLNAELVLVHAVPRLVPALVDDNTKYKIIDYAKEEALSELELLAKRNIPDRISVTFKTTEKHLVNFLPRLIPKRKDTLIMLGLKGTGMLKKVFLGSVATQIIDELNELTVGIPIKIHQAKPESLIITVNPKYPINKKKLDQLLKLLHSSLKNIEFISIVKSDDIESKSLNYLQELSEEYQDRISTSYRIFKSKKSFDELKSYMGKRNESFLVLQKGFPALTDLTFRRFFINKIIHDGSIPLIILPE